MYWTESVQISITGYPQVSPIINWSLFILPRSVHIIRLKDESTCERGANMHSDTCTLLSQAGPWNEGVLCMHGIRWHERTGKAVESLAKSTTSGSSSNMLFSIMFLGRLARSTTHTGREIRRMILKRGNERGVREIKNRNQMSYTRSHTHTHTVL